LAVLKLRSVLVLNSTIIAIFILWLIKLYVKRDNSIIALSNWHKTRSRCTSSIFWLSFINWYTNLLIRKIFFSSGRLGWKCSSLSHSNYARRFQRSNRGLRTSKSARPRIRINTGSNFRNLFWAIATIIKKWVRT